ncbi:MAG: hypothetical protein IJU55_00080 [Selenomonadaceae bacterium]|nr:hypothetical protein [Selenomonadaceae bacterium]
MAISNSQCVIRNEKTVDLSIRRSVDLKYLAGEEIKNFSPLTPYSDEVCNFLSDFSSELLKDFRYREFPDAATVAFFSRKGNIQRLKKNFVDENFRLGKGLAFHITPSNIPVQFMFSYFFGLLAGNANVVRVASKNYPQVDFLCEILNKILSRDEYKKIREMTAIVRYDRESDWTKIFSAKCHVRLIWGGDSTIENIRKIPIPPRATELVFADRYSFAIIDENSVENLNDAELNRLAQNFYNDTYLVDQNACSSPHLILWKSSKNFRGREKFWTAVEKIVHEKYDFPPIKATTKYTNFCRNEIDFPQTEKLFKHDNFLYRVKVSAPFKGIENLRGKFGLFYENNFSSWEDWREIINEKFQTLTYFGFDSKILAQEVVKNNWLGIDRIIPIGRALDIGIFWDGYDLIGQMSRIIYTE